MLAGQPLFNSVTVTGNVRLMSFPQGVDGIQTRPIAGAHRLGGEVGVSTGAIPVSLDRLWIQGSTDVEILRNPIQQPPGDP